MTTRGTPVTAGGRVIASATVGLAVAGVVALLGPWQFAALTGWVAMASVFVVWIWVTVWTLDGDDTSRLATREDSSRPATDLVLTSSAVASLVGVAFALVKASAAHGAGKAALIAVALVTVVVSWVAVHTVFTLRYAREYYDGEDGGVDFNEPGHPPDYQDFAYLAITVGMTFQVSDTDITSHRMRSTVIRHALLSYLFGAVIVAMAINVVAGLLNR
ncbi:MAG: hypothetical protein JWO37_3931 [Acidimicrobiales bacterium]|jgi:uncharacterized membrane protein|nr:hypothetical protein [Acidimicrobiales bacterium]